MQHEVGSQQGGNVLSGMSIKHLRVLNGPITAHIEQKNLEWFQIFFIVLPYGFESVHLNYKSISISRTQKAFCLEKFLYHHRKNFRQMLCFFFFFFKTQETRAEDIVFPYGKKESIVSLYVNITDENFSLESSPKKKGSGNCEEIIHLSRHQNFHILLLGVPKNYPGSFLCKLGTPIPNFTICPRRSDPL